MRDTVIGLAGPIGSGKTSVALGIARKLECPVASFGLYVRTVASHINRQDSRQSLQETSEELLTSLGPLGLTRNVLTSSGWDHQHTLVVDGIRHPNVLAALKVEAKPLPVVLVYLDVSAERQHERLATRDSLSVGEIAGFEAHSTEQSVRSGVRALADVILCADGRLEQLVEAALTAIYSLP